MAKKQKTDKPVKYQLRFLRSHRKYHKGDVAVFTEEKAKPYLQDVAEGGPFAELVDIFEDDSKQAVQAHAASQTEEESDE